MAGLSLLSARKRAKDKKLLLMEGAIWYLYLRTEHQHTRSVWARDWLLRREDYGAYSTLLSELQETDQVSFIKFLRMSPGIYEDLLRRVTPLIQRQETNFRSPISPGMRLAITLRYLATGETYMSLSFLFRVANNTIGKIVPETCAAIHSVLEDDYYQCPSSIEDWKQVAHDYNEQWQFPNCLGSLDGKHVVIRKPGGSGATYFNYKHTFSIILLALVDANYKFLFTDIGAQGRCSDAGVFAESDLNEALQRNTLNIPGPSPLPGTEKAVPYCLVADDAFPLRINLMKPFPHRNLTKEQRIYNYRLSRARRCVENAFGIMSNRFRVLLNPICLKPAKVDVVIQSCCALHNMLRTVMPGNYIAVSDESVTVTHNNNHGACQVIPGARVDGRRSATKAAKEHRDYLCQYFSSPVGSVSWQDKMV